MTGAPGKPGASHVTNRKRNAVLNKMKTYQINRRIIRDYKLARGCIDCGYPSLSVLKTHSHNHIAQALDLDHTYPGNKYRTASGKAIKPSAIANRYSTEVLYDQLYSCEVRCKCCHAIKTAMKQSLGSFG